MTDPKGLEAARRLLAQEWQTKDDRYNAPMSLKDGVTVARALLAGEGNNATAAAVPIDPWQPISTAPKDRTTVALRGELLAHHMAGCKFSMMPPDWRPETPQTEWRVTEWRKVVPSNDQAAVREAKP